MWRSLETTDIDILVWFTGFKEFAEVMCITSCLINKYIYKLNGAIQLAEVYLICGIVFYKDIARRY